jgi:hypothetical protein
LFRCSWYSTEGSKNDQLSGNKWFQKSQALTGDGAFIAKEGEKLFRLLGLNQTHIDGA